MLAIDQAPSDSLKSRISERLLREFCLQLGYSLLHVVQLATQFGNFVASGRMRLRLPRCWSGCTYLWLRVALMYLRRRTGILVPRRAIIRTQAFQLFRLIERVRQDVASSLRSQRKDQPL